MLGQANPLLSTNLHTKIGTAWEILARPKVRYMFQRSVPAID